MGTEEARKQTEVHNAAFTNHAQNAQTLNDNVTQWLLGTVNIPDDEKGSRRPDTYSVRSRFLRSLFAPNYTVFSNTASQNQWIKEHGNGSSSHYVVSLESPHNAIHLALGGFYEAGVYNASPIRGANGDMGDNDTASFDPIFFFHHCFIDYAFAVWQRLWGFTTRGSLTVIPDYNGTILEDGQPPNHSPGTHLDMTTPLYPFQMHSGEYYNSDDVTDLNDLGYTYGPGSLDALIVGVDPSSQKSPSDTLTSQFGLMALAKSDPHVDRPLSLIQHGNPITLAGTDPTAGSPLALTQYGLDPITLAGSDPTADNPFPVIKWVHHINRAQFKGSFVIRLYARGHDGKEVEVGREAVLSRWDIQGCRNCQGHLDVDLYVPIDARTLEYLQGTENAKIGWRVFIQTHELPRYTRTSTVDKQPRYTVDSDKQAQLHHYTADKLPHFTADKVPHYTADPGEEEQEGVYEPQVDDL
jgi:hypothetical protein